MGVLRVKVDGQWVDILSQTLTEGGIDVAADGVVVSVDTVTLNFTGPGVTVTTGAAGEAVINIAGAAPPPAPLEFSFPTPLPEWTIDHNLGTRSLEVNCYDLAGSELDPEIEFVDDNQVLVHWFTPTAGVARIVRD